MAIRDLLDQTQPKARKGPPCTVCLLLSRLHDDEAAALRRLLADTSVRYSALAEALRSEGHEFSGYTLSRHARGQCEGREALR